VVDRDVVAVTDDLSEGLDEAAVDLDRHDPGRSIGQRQRQGPQARSDLDDDVVRTDVDVLDDPLDGVGIADEVLAVLLARRQPVAVQQVGDVDR
jgi:hypothetical protein